MSTKITSHGRRAPVQERSRATVTAIRQAAARILRSEGYERATTNHIAQVAGVSIGTLYQYFDGRDAVFDALIDDVLDSVVEAAGAAVSSPGPANLEARLHILASTVLRVLTSHPSVLRQLDAIPGSSFRSRLQDAKARARDLLESLLALHASELTVTDLPLASRIVTDVAEGLVYNLQTGEDVDVVAREAARLIHAYLTGAHDDSVRGS